MKRINPLSQFVLVFLVVFVVLIAPWNGLNEKIKDVVIDQIEWVAGVFDPQAVIQVSDGNEQHDIQINVANRRLVQAGGALRSAVIRIHSRGVAYLPMVLVFALILSSPVSLKRRLLAIPIGLILIQMVILLKFYIILLFKFNQHEWIKLHLLNPFWKKILNFTFTYFAEPIEPSFFLALAIWLVVVFRKK